MSDPVAQPAGTQKLLLCGRWRRLEAPNLGHLAPPPDTDQKTDSQVRGHLTSLPVRFFLFE